MQRLLASQVLRIGVHFAGMTVRLTAQRHAQLLTHFGKILAHSHDAYFCKYVDVSFLNAPVPDAAAVAAAPLGNNVAAPGTGNRGAARLPSAGAGEAVPERGSLPVGCGTPAT